MKAVFHVLRRAVCGALALAGVAALLFAATLFTNLPWRAYSSLAQLPAPAAGAPSHVFVMGGTLYFLALAFDIPGVFGCDFHLFHHWCIKVSQGFT